MKSQLMTQIELARLQVSGKTLEQDERGIKVTLLPDGNMLKVFRLRGWFSSSLIYSNARSFCRNAVRLQKRNIPTVEIVSLHHIESSSFKAVVYVPIAGESVRNLLGQALANDKMFDNLGIFIAKLHQHGIHFRSLHLGNIILCNDGSLGLIDIADMRIYPWPLFCNTRARNFKHLCRYESDMQRLGKEIWQALLRGYFNYSSMAATCQAKINRTITGITNIFN
jgi:tRNA A-37 threonylcarbamoyl transferase component Bud32